MQRRHIQNVESDRAARVADGQAALNVDAARQAAARAAARAAETTEQRAARLAINQIALATGRGLANRNQQYITL